MWGEPRGAAQEEEVVDGDVACVASTATVTIQQNNEKGRTTTREWSFKLQQKINIIGSKAPPQHQPVVVVSQSESACRKASVCSKQASKQEDFPPEPSSNCSKELS